MVRRDIKPRTPPDYDLDVRMSDEFGLSEEIEQEFCEPEDGPDEQCPPSESVLNPFLYRALARRFGEVTISHPGEERIAASVEDYVTGRSREQVRQAGEQYLVRCPFCRAARSLAVNHMFGTDDGSGQARRWLAWCHNCQRLRDPEAREKLVEMLVSDERLLAITRIRPGRASRPLIPGLPSPSVPIRSLPGGHPARQYFDRIGLNVEKLSAIYDLYYCHDCQDKLADSRVVIPVRQAGKLAGWQALSLSCDPFRRNADRPAKYLSARGMRASELVYNLDKARQYHTGIIVAEPLEVWRFGPMAMCSLVDFSSPRYLRAICSAFRDKPLALLTSARDIGRGPTADVISALRRRCGGLVVVQMRNGKSILSSDRMALRQIVVRQAAAVGVEVRFTKT